MANIALLLDLDNIKPKLSTIESICEKHGTVVVRRAFANTPAVLTCYGSNFRDFNYRFELTPGLTSVPQEVDNLIQQTIWELVDNPKMKIDIIAIVSNDNDYANIFSKLKTKGIITLVIGNQIGNQLRQTADYVEILQELIRPTYVGIDLGTTNTVMALANYHDIRNEWIATPIDVNLPNELGYLVRGSIISSSVRFSSQTEAQVGGHVKAQAYAFRDQTILAWKHNMGYSTDGNPFYYDLTIGKVYPEEGAAQILNFCRHKLLQQYTEVQGAVITHPASYEADAIQATRKAAVLAGWKVEEVVLLSEPQAALYDFLHRLQRGDLPPVPIDVQKPSNLLVYDLGGGTLDVTLHQVQWDQTEKKFIIEDLAIGSRTRIGGDSVDRLIAEFICQNSPGYVELSEAAKKKLEYEIIIYAEKFKKAWGGEYEFSPDKANFSFPFQGIFLEGNFPILYRMTAQKMREILAPLLCEDITLASVETLNPDTAFDEPIFTERLNSFIVPVIDVLLRAKQSLNYVPKIDAVLLNGGMTYFLPVRERLTQLFENIPILNQGDPDLAVARGAALYAAGAIKPTARVNPTNIYLEVNRNGETNLVILIKQGEKFPYKTVVKGFELPNHNRGYLALNIWVGMGSKPNVNTSLQRRRCIALSRIYEYNLQPGCLLDLEIEYTFDESLFLTLVAQEDEEARFPLEVSADTEEEIDIIEPDITQNRLSDDDIDIIIPSIPRVRNEIPLSPGLRVDFRDWQVLAANLANNWTNAKLQCSKQRLERQAVRAENRIGVVHELIKWLDISSMKNLKLAKTQALIAVMALSKIFQSLDANEYRCSTLEERFKGWITQQFDNGLSNLDYDLFNAIAETPGKLFWLDFDDYLVDKFNSYKRQPMSQIFLNSLAKCGRPTPKNISLLKDVVRNNQNPGVQEKAAWALGRLISPGQPEKWQANFQDVEDVVILCLDQLYYHVTIPQVALNLLVCLSQGLAWRIKGKRFNQEKEICDRVVRLTTATLPVERHFPRYNTIQKLFESRLSVIPKMLEVDKASSQDITVIIELLKQVQ